MIGFSFDYENNQMVGKNHYGKSVFYALMSLSNQYPNNQVTDEDCQNLVTGFIKWFDQNINKYLVIAAQIGCNDYDDQHPEELILLNDFEGWALTLFNWLRQNSYIYPIPTRFFTLNLSWTGALGIDFRGRNSFEILESFAINHRKKAYDIDAHRHGLKKFIENFERDMGKYFGFYGSCNDGFLEFLLSTKVFKSLER